MVTRAYHGEQPGVAYDEAWWEAVFACYDEAFPGLSGAIRRAESTGASWREMSTPFAWFEADRCVAHVGVLTHPMWLNGRRVDVAGVHAVCTVEARRRQGLCRELLRRALAWADRTHAVVKLHTDDPPVYTGHGFEVCPTHHFVASVAPAPITPARRLLQPSTQAEDAALLASLLDSRAPVSARVASADPGWMVTIVAALSGRLDDALWWLPEHEAIVSFDEEDDHTVITEVIAPLLPDAATILAAAPDPSLPARWGFCPDLLDPDARPVLAPPEVGAFMTRGAWPLTDPFGLSPLWEH